ncbi:tetratricopeptide repeat protein 9C isoform X2 [Rhinatrema bivittatum]|uniref:tetratricopeptide repeat protein 9C isoform X2 n=1 Tax=Rhinatrema bivittatum TaxID=194408 RepID=UPI00112820AE|nr:tetratricopeptide repeat protein 9C isoform X2 [Rhinatrema bivittatum]
MNASYPPFPPPPLKAITHPAEIVADPPLLRVSPDGALNLRLQQAQKFKEAGNQSYKEQHFRDAVSRYHRALLQLRGLDPSVLSSLQAFGAETPALTQAQEQTLHNTQRDCYNNLAACLLHMEPVNYERVREYSLKVLLQQPENVKALYRAGVAFYHLRDYDQAHHYLSEAARREPKDTNVKRYLRLTESELSSYQQQQQQMYLGMFG